MFLNVHITKWPCVIISNWRVGSTGLLFHMADYYKTNLSYNEPLIKIDNKFQHTGIKDFMLKFSGKANYLVKFHGWQLLTNPSLPYQKLVESDAFKIRILRRNIIDQITSYYIGLNHTFVFQKTEKYTVPTVPINKYNIYKCIDRIVRSNLLVDRLKITYELELHFEDIMPLDNSVTDSARKYSPVNRDEIRAEVENLYALYENTKDIEDLSWIPYYLNPHKHNIQQEILHKYFNI